MPPGLDLIGRLPASWFVVGLIAARALGMVATAPGLGPGFGLAGLGVRVRLALAGVLAALVAPALGPGLDAPTRPADWLGAIVVELAVGAALGWSSALVIAGARQAGEVVGGQAGLAPASLFDPDAGDGMTPLGHLYGLVALAVFLALDGPTRLVLGLAESYRVVPAGGGPAGWSGEWLTPDLADHVAAAIGRGLVLAVQASAPAALALTLAGLALGLLGRTAPSLQLVSASLPTRTLLGLVLAALGIVPLVAWLAVAWRATFPWAAP